MGALLSVMNTKAKQDQENWWSYKSRHMPTQIRQHHFRIRPIYIARDSNSTPSVLARLVTTVSAAQEYFGNSRSKLQ